MGFKRGEDRYQVRLLPPAIEDYVPQDSEVRVIDAFVDKLNDIKFQYSDFSGCGNQPYNPKDMLKIYIYCYLKGIRSSRKIESECKVNAFLYDNQKGVYICPAKREMYCVGQETHKKGKKKLRHKIYKEKHRCKDCKLREQCFNNQNGSRRILRWEKEGIVDKMKTKESRDKLRQKKGIVEPVFGIIKR